MSQISFISYLDLLGIKEMSRYNPNGYFEAMNHFRDKIIKCASEFKEESQKVQSQIHFFSDCCFIESHDLTRIFKFLRKLRRELIKENSLFFSASVTTGKLGAVSLSADSSLDPNSSVARKIIENGVSEYVSGTVFQSEDISKVYVLQTDFKGTGVYIEKECILKWKGTFENENEFYTQYNEFITESFYFPSINTNTVRSYYDLRIVDNENRPLYFNRIINKYYNANAKNKKYGRFYLALLANWVSSAKLSHVDINDFESKEKLENLPVILRSMVRKSSIINEISKNAHCYEYLYFFLLGRLYFERGQADSVTHYFVNEVLRKNVKSKRLLSNLDSLPDSILKPEYKEILIQENHDLLTPDEGFFDIEDIDS